MMPAILLAGIILILGVPLLIGAWYSYPSADDFISAASALEWVHNNGRFWGYYYVLRNFYLTWQGTHLSSILMLVVLPYTHFGLNGFRVIMVLIALFFEVSLYFMVYGITVYSNLSQADAQAKTPQRNKRLFLYAVLLFASLGLPGTWIAKEIFYWYTGAVVYIVGYSLLFLSIGCFFLANCREKKKRYYICSALFGFMASGTNPEVVAFVCAWHLIALFTVIMSDKSCRKQIHFWNILPFLASFISALFNVFSPGDMIRSHITMEEGVSYGVTDAVRDSFRTYGKELSEILRDPYFITLMIIVFLVSIYFKVRVLRTERPLTAAGLFFMAFCVFVSHFLTIFPVEYGYHGMGLYNDRTKYTAEFEIRFSLLFFLFCLAQYVSGKLSGTEKRRRIFYSAVVLCGVILCTAGYLSSKDHLKEIGAGFSFELTKDFASGNMRKVFSLRKQVLEAFEDAADGTDVYLEMPAIPPARSMYPQGLSEDPGAETNRAAASMFRLTSVAVKYADSE